jgi:hypothetical protein
LISQFNLDSILFVVALDYSEVHYCPNFIQDPTWCNVIVDAPNFFRNHKQMLRSSSDLKGLTQAIDYMCVRFIQCVLLAIVLRVCIIVDNLCGYQSNWLVQWVGQPNLIVAIDLVYCLLDKLVVNH